MASVRQNILNQLKATIEGIGTIKYVEINRALPVVVDQVAFPAAFVYSGDEYRVEGAIGYETWDWNIVVEIWCNQQEDDTEDLLKIIHDTVYAEVAWNPLVKDILRTGTSEFIVDPTNELKGLSIAFTVQYQNVWGVM